MFNTNKSIIAVTFKEIENFHIIVLLKYFYTYNQFKIVIKTIF